MAEMRLQQRQTAQLSAQQVMTNQLLQLPLMQLEQRIYDEVQDNPMLELVEERRQDDGAAGSTQAATADSAEMFDSVSRFERSSMKVRADGGNRETVSAGRTSGSASGGEERFFQAVQHDTLHERLLRDLSLQEGIGEREVRIAAEILGNLDSDGYLTEPLEVIIDGLRQSDIDASEADVREIQQKIWYLDPPGVAVANLRERLLVELSVYEHEHDPEAVGVARTILNEAFDDFMNKRFDRLLKKLNLQKRQLEAAIDVITSLDPHPGEAFFDEGGHYISPDFIVIYENGALTAVLNDRSSLSVRVSDEYREVLAKRKVPKEDRQFMRQKLQRANEFVTALQVRRQTLLKVMEALLVAQAKFFIDGPRYLQPLVMKTIAEQTGYDISTISRAVNGKYVQTRFGVFELKYFFSGAVSTDEGEELSSRIIKQQLRDLIEGENPVEPLSDDRLAELLSGKGVQIARRTVAKYREQMQIPVARLRKKIG
ncbi:MAG TPA: RNA polymerase sigma-54 factor [Chlorobaculum sp.]|uniref:RNA polymerase sigma-54 factor n=1 Tax=Chlorobaculum tepidum (strain ATCC 49652 / DSM 12025 / NBRC 103806 / TLS) TaxID=194439 RepID=Q8KD61_CHLTE|nr:RNA polymerase factor sigma-54 [Chlorobaculum tepidum]AAM72426.1 RNA polymerase sigma-54 factor [Chlorobaculum tepidum TLS]HBU23934.1 RNA polymerase sigma-54 factor [Chlorobaculum sp.]